MASRLPSTEVRGSIPHAPNWLPFNDVILPHRPHSRTCMIGCLGHRPVTGDFNVELERPAEKSDLTNRPELLSTDWLGAAPNVPHSSVFQRFH